MLDFRSETFLTVCRCMNFTKAAEQLGITQPAVSQHIKYIEESYGVKLFAFSGKKVALTDAGRLLQNALTTMKHDEIHLREALQKVNTGMQSLHFGLTLTIGEFVIPSKLAAYLADYPQTRVSIVIANTHELLDKLDNGEIDFAIVEGYFDAEKYDNLVYSEEQYICVCSADSPLCAQNQCTCTLNSLQNQRLIIRERGSGTREILERYLEDRNLSVSSFENCIELSNMNAIKQLVEYDCGITFMYRAAVKKELEAGRLRRVNIKDFDVKHDFTFIWRKNSIFADYYRDIFLKLS